MDLRQVAKGAPYHLATSIEECPLWRFWVVLLEGGIEVYQTVEDPTLKEHSPWIRLKQFCKDHGLKIMSMAFARKDFNQMAQINLKPAADGYFYSKRIRRMMAANPAWSDYQDEAQGFGELNGDRLTIHWVDSNDGTVTTENRSLGANKKATGLIGLIKN